MSLCSLHRGRWGQGSDDEDVLRLFLGDCRWNCIDFVKFPWTRENSPANSRRFYKRGTDEGQTNGSIIVCSFVRSRTKKASISNTKTTKKKKYYQNPINLLDLRNSSSLNSQRFICQFQTNGKMQLRYLLNKWDHRWGDKWDTTTSKKQQNILLWTMFKGTDFCFTKYRSSFNLLTFCLSKSKLIKRRRSVRTILRMSSHRHGLCICARAEVR